jgi:hypothetical protein
LEFLYNLAIKNNADISICGSWRQLENGTIEPKYIFDEFLLHDTETAVAELIFRTHYNSGTPTKLFKKKLFDNIRFPNQGKYDDISTTYKLFAASQLTAIQGKGKYYASRHENNNSKASIKHQSLEPHFLDEYLSVFRERTEYINGTLPNLTNMAKWSEWSYMISMVEKIKRFELKNCDEPLNFMLNELKTNQYKFMHSPWTQEFEKEWMEEYVQGINT